MAVKKYFYELTISSSPHVHAPVTTQTIMRDVLLALVPALVGSVVFFGLRALMVTLISIAGCVFFEWLWDKLRKRPCKVYPLFFELSRLSYGVYLLHMFVLVAVFDIVKGWEIGTPLTMFVSALLTYIGSFVVAKLLSLLPKSKYIIG